MDKPKVCPVCGGMNFILDYDRNGEEELPVNRCSKCGWPPNAPMSVEEYRRKVKLAGLIP